MRRLMTAVLSLSLAACLVAALAGCGTTVAGTYTAESGDPEFTTAELVVDDDDTFELSAEIVGTRGDGDRHRQLVAGRRHDHPRGRGPQRDRDRYGR